MRTRAFTLIELLTVVSIIGVVAAILFPVFARAKEKANATMDLSQMRQIGIASRLYADEYDSDELPLGVSWRVLYEKYGVSHLLSPGHTQGPPERSEFSTGYATNVCYTAGSFATPEPSRTIIIAPAACIEYSNRSVFCDESIEVPDFQRSYLKPGTFAYHFLRVFGRFGSSRFLGGGNYVMYDLHGKWTRPEAIYAPVPPTCRFSNPGIENTSQGISFATLP
ncbi:MAG: type II secretion system protein [Fimbriimonadaceae bacterium]|nr:type II secretion system protein [Fimbriimonadaceae bacterium]